MARPNSTSIINISEGNRQRLVDNENALITSLIADLNNDNPTVRKAAREMMIELGFTQNVQEGKGVVPFLLEKARAGEFGEYVKAFSRTQEQGSSPITSYKDLNTINPPQTLVSQSPALEKLIEHHEKKMETEFLQKLADDESETENEAGGLF